MSATLETRCVRVTDLRMGEVVHLAMYPDETDTVVRVERGEVPGQVLVLYSSGRTEAVRDDARRVVIA